jgi:fibronectin type 3 domain-containing protein
MDEQGNLYATGVTRSSDFPVTTGALQEDQGGPYTEDIYVLKLRSDGSALAYASYIGGIYPETPGDVAVRDGRAYVTGMTEGSDFPYGNITAKYYGGVPFVMVLSEDGSRLDTIISWPVTRSVRPEAIVIDDDGAVFVGGMCGAWDLPVTPDAYMTEPNWSPRSFIIKCDPWTNETFVCSYFSTAGAYIEDMELDAEGNLYLAGLAYNFTMGGLELTEGAWCTTYKGTRDLFVTKMDPNVTHVIYSTLVGGNSYDFAGDLAVTDGGVATLVGWCWDATGLVTSSNAHDVDNEGVYEGFVVALSEDGSSVVQSTLMGGTHGDHVTCVEVTPEETLLLAGYTESKGFPVTEGAYQGELMGNRDMFVMELAVLHPPSVPRNLTATGGDGNISLEWMSPLDDAGFAIINYTVHRNDTEGGMEVIHITGPITSFVDEDVEYGVNYSYRVAAFNGRGMSDLSNLANGCTVTFPDPPTNLTGSVLADHVKLAWRTPLFTGGLPLGDYNLYRAVEDGPLELHARVIPLVVSFVDTAVEDRVTYTYVLAATNGHGESRGNPTITFRMTGRPTPPLFLDYAYGERYIEINWSKPVEDYDLPVVRYHVYRSTGTGAAKLVGVINAPDLMLRDRAVEVGVVYRYHVVAENSKGMSDPSMGIEARTMVRPDEPREVEAMALELFVRVTWKAPEFDGASPLMSYRVYNVDESGAAVHLGDVNVEGVDAPRLVFLHGMAYDGVSRRYFVTAVNAEGESDPSEEAWTTMFQVPSPPHSLEADWGDERVVLEWVAPEDDGGTPVTSYSLFRRVSGEHSFVHLATAPVGSLRYVDDNVANGVEYDYWVTAWNLAGESGPSSEVTVMPAGPPTVPRQVTAEGGNGSVVVRWGVPEWDGGLPLTGYRVYRVSDGMQAELLVELGVDQREFTHGDLVNGIVHLYAVQALSGAGGSELSQLAEGRPAGAPTAPQALIAVWMDGMVYVTWSSPQDDGGAPITGYRIHREDWDTGNWTELPAFGLMYSDDDVEHNGTYNYTLLAFNDVGPGPIVMLSFTAPPAEETEDDGLPTFWLLLVMAAVAALLAAIYFFWRRPPTYDIDDGQVEEG